MTCSECYRSLPFAGPCPHCALDDQESQDHVRLCFERIAVEFKPSGPAHAWFVWRFEDAPECLRALSTNGGDEDWLVYIGAPAKLDWVPSWVEALDSCREPDRFDLPDGAVVYIGAHA